MHDFQNYYVSYNHDGLVQVFLFPSILILEFKIQFKLSNCFNFKIHILVCRFHVFKKLLIDLNHVFMLDLLAQKDPQEKPLKKSFLRNLDL